MKTKKTFDCLKMKDEAQQRRARMLQGLSDDERLEFYRQAGEALRRRQERLRSGGADQRESDSQ